MGDPFENTDAAERIMYYFTDGIPFPTAVFDGTNMIIGGEPETIDAYLSAYYAELLNASPCTLNLLVEYDSTLRFLKVKSRVTAVDTFSNVHLRYAIAESHIHHHWTGLDSLHHVVRKMLPDHNGVAFNINPGESFVDSQTYVLDSTWNDKNCYVVVFVQRDDSDTLKPVFRSAKSGQFQILPRVFGDANGDGQVNVLDIVYLINYLFLGGPAPYLLANGDPNSDCIVNVTDIVYLINYIFIWGPESSGGCAW